MKRFSLWDAKSFYFNLGFGIFITSSMIIFDILDNKIKLDEKLADNRHFMSGIYAGIGIFIGLYAISIIFNFIDTFRKKHK